MNELNVKDDELSDSEDNDQTCPLWSIGGCFLCTFGTALTGATFLSTDANPHEMTLKLCVSIAMLTVGFGFCGAGMLITRYGLFPDKQNKSSEDVNENTNLVGIERRM